MGLSWTRAELLGDHADAGPCPVLVPRRPQSSWGECTPTSHLALHTFLPLTGTTGMGGHSLLWGIFPTQELNRGLRCCRWILHHLSHLRSPLPLLGFASTKSWDRQTAIHSQAVVSPDQYCVVLTVTFLFVAAPTPKRQKCDHWSPCPEDTYAYRLLSGGGRDKYAKICFEDEM